MSFRIDYRPSPRVLQSLGQEHWASAVRRFRQAMARAEAFAKRNVTQVLRTVTGNLRRGITHTVEEGGGTVVGRLGAKPRYAAIHELGGTIPAHIVRPRRKRALRFTVGGQVVFARYANIPSIAMPPRPYLRPGLDEAFDRFESDIESDVRRFQE